MTIYPIILLNVTEINDPPILEKIKNIIVFEGQLVKIIPNATDSENDSLTYNFSSPINASGEWKTSIGDEGVYQVSASEDYERQDATAILLIKK